jgi:hypothetical protein
MKELNLFSNRRGSGSVCNPSKSGFKTSEKRFSEFRELKQKTSVFLGPGRYDDNEKYHKLKNRPCSAVYVTI